MPLAADELKARIALLVGEAQTARQSARNRGAPFESWFSQAEVIISSLGVQGDAFSRRLKQLQDFTAYEHRLADLDRERQIGVVPRTVAYGWMVDAAVGVLDGLTKALDSGLLTTVEDRVASEIYGDVLLEADQLLKANHLSCAAILVRAGLESGLKRVARREGMPDVEKAKASVVNGWLWKERKLYPKATHDAAQGWLAPGNAFAHDLPEKDKYTHRDIAKALADVQSFLGSILA